MVEYPSGYNLLQREDAHRQFNRIYAGGSSLFFFPISPYYGQDTQSRISLTEWDGTQAEYACLVLFREDLRSIGGKNYIHSAPFSRTSFARNAAIFRIRALGRGLS